MSLTIALQTAVSSLQANQLALDVTSNNVANANTEGYTRKTLDQQTQVIDGRGAGVFTTGVTRSVDAQLLRELRVQSSDMGAFTAKETFYDRMQSLFGSVMTDSSVAASITELDNKLQAMAVDPEGVSQRTDVVDVAVNLTRELGRMGRELQGLRSQADAQIADAVDIVNSQLTMIEDLNRKIARNQALGLPTGELEDQRDNAINKIAEQIDVSYFTRDNGEVVIFTTGGGRVLLDREKHLLSHDAVSTMDAAITHADGGVPGIMLDGVDITSEIKSGRIGGLIDVRDARVPNLVAELDRLAAMLRDELNALHNDGTAFPAPNALTGTKTFAAGDTLSAEGSVRIAVVDQAGEYVDDGGGNPDYVDIDLAALSSAVGGTLTVQNVIDAINGGVIPGFSGVSGATASLANGNLVVRADNAAHGVVVDGTNIDGSLGTNGSVDVSNVTTGGDITAFPAPTVQLATSGISVAAANQLESVLVNGDLPLNVETTAGGPGQVRLSADANFAFGAVNGGAGSALGQATGAPSGDLAAGGTVEVALDSNGDGTGDTVIGTLTFAPITLAGATAGGAQGSLSIQGIDVSRDTAVKVGGETRTFAHYFGLNDFFTTSTNYDIYSSAPQTTKTAPVGATGTLSFSGTFAGSPATVNYTANDTLESLAAAINADATLQTANIKASVVTEGDKVRLRILDDDGNNFTITDSGSLLSDFGFGTNTTGIMEDLEVRESLVADPALISRGGLENGTAPAIGAAAITAGDNTVVQRMANKFSENLSFARAGGLPPTTNTLAGYGSSILALNSVEATNVSNTLEFKKTLVTDLDTRLKNQSGVNVDEELAKVALFQNSYNASARLISVVSDMLETLTDIVR